MLNYLESVNKKKFYIIILSSLILVSFVGSYIIGYIVGEDTLDINFFKNKNLLYIFVITVIIGPLVETLIFQLGIIEIVLYYRSTKFSGYLALSISSFLFGLTHNYNIYYIIFGTFIGFILAASYLIAKKRKDMSPFLLVCFAHAIINLIAFFHNDIFQLG